MADTYFWNNGHWALLNQPSSSPNGLDRGLQFGDGLFETIRLSDRLIDKDMAPLAAIHQQRLEKGLAVLGFTAQSISQIQQAFTRLSDLANPNFNAIKFIVTRGNSIQGYFPPIDALPNIYALPFAAPKLTDKPTQINAGINVIRLGEQPLLAGLKHLNRLEQVLARKQFQPDWSESVMLNQKGQVVEGCMSNIFVKINDQWLTPPIDTAGVNGVVRQWLLSKMKNIRESIVSLDDLASASSICFSNSLSGFRNVETLDGRTLKLSSDVTEWQMHYKSLFDEC